MADYNRTVWKDHIKDQSGNVIQQGIPVSAKNLNNIENQLVILSAKENTLAELIRETIPSGFTSLSDIDYAYMSTNPNTIRLISDSVAFVNGYKVVIPAGTVIQLDAPPTSGSREDLVFLECWKQSDANGSVSWNYRIRVVDGVDFNTHPEGLRKNGELFANCVNVQGALSSPSTIAFTQSVNQSDSTMYYKNYDCGLYIPNNWTPNGTSLDGYVYAIPMFKIHRRNSGGYSANNGNGAYLFASGLNYASLPNWNQAATSNTVQVSVAFIANVNVGDVLKMAGSSLPINTNNLYTYLIVTAKDTANNKLTLLTLCGSIGGIQNGYLMASPRRHDMTFADIVDARDIIDLRHQVSLTGFNYQQLLEENFDKLLRGGLQTSAKIQMIKTYHGALKTPIDSNHVFYASLDGNTNAELGGAPIAGGVAIFSQSPTGLACKPSVNNIVYNNISLGNSFTLEFWIDTNKLLNDYVLLNCGSDCRIEVHPNLLYLCGSFSPNYDKSNYVVNWLSGTGYKHIRIVVSGTNRTFYVNGKQQFKTTNASNFTGNTAAVTLYVTNTPICDLAISNIDRGSNFATLPQDLIDGYARISNAFNEQRNVLSDALTTEIDFVQVKCSGANGKAISLGDSTDWAKDDGTKWNPGDRVKVKGLCGEIITGVMDADTALARVVQGDGNTGSTQLYVDDVSKISINDTIRYYNSTNGVSGGADLTVSAIDSTNKIITVNVAQVPKIGDLIFETTISTSSPKVQYFNGSNLVDVTGTWSGLGTNEATFTLGTNASLTNQDLYITYGLNEMPGQGGISEVLTTTLAGECNGKRLTVNPSVHVRDDFAGKISGSININPNIAKTLNSGNDVNYAPSNTQFTEIGDQYYSAINSLNGAPYLSSTINSAGKISQQLFSFNLIRILEDKFGILPCGSDIYSKVAWIKANVKSVTFNWWGYGSCQSGNLANLRVYSYTNSTWNSSSNNTTSVPSLIQLGIIDMLQYLMPDGFMHFLVYSGASDGTIPSSILTDYACVDIILNTPNGYDVLAPENPRRDDGKSNILLVRKETKEIQTIFNRGNNDGIITYGDYVPYQGCANKYGPTFKVIKISDWMLLTTNGTGGTTKSINGHIFTPQLCSIKNLPLSGILSDSNYCKDNILTDIPPYTWNDCNPIDSTSTYRTIIQKGGSTEEIVPSVITLAYGFNYPQFKRGVYNAVYNWYNGFKALINNVANVNYLQAVPLLLSCNGALLLCVITFGKADGFIGTNPYCRDNSVNYSIAIDIFKVDKNIITK